MTLQRLDFELRGDHIALDALLKATGLAPSGGAAKRMVAEGRVQVDGRDEARKTCKIRAGQVVSIAGATIRVRAAGSESAAPRAAEILEDETLAIDALGLEGPDACAQSSR